MEFPEDWDNLLEHSCTAQEGWEDLIHVTPRQFSCTSLHKDLECGQSLSKGCKHNIVLLGVFHDLEQSNDVFSTNNK